MNVQDVFSGAWGSGTAVTILGAFMVFFVKRSLLKYDAHIDRQYKNMEDLEDKQDRKLNELKDRLSDIKVDLGIMSTQIKGLTKSLDKINTNGCNKCRAAHSKPD